MNYFQRRRLRQSIKHLLHEARHARHMRADIAPAALVARVRAGEQELKRAWDGGRAETIELAADQLATAVSELYPPKPHPKWRENVEILAVALSIAMAFRTYFIQPFKIPTGSMQPTLYGITVEAQSQKRLMDYFPLNLVNLALFGERYAEVRAKTAGQLDERYLIGEESRTFYIAGMPHVVRHNLTMHVSPGEHVAKGQLIASGRVKLGAHIFVDKVRYNFTRPTRGEIIVFSTDGIDYPRIRPNTFYIKRLVGLPGETITLDPPYLVADGQRITAPYPFERLLKATDKGYVGYRFAKTDMTSTALLQKPGDEIRVGAAQFLPFGDNTMFSLDGRYFGPVDRQNLVGPAFFVYWPFTKRFGGVK